MPDRYLRLSSFANDVSREDKESALKARKLSEPKRKISTFLGNVPVNGESFQCKGDYTLSMLKRTLNKYDEDKEYKREPHQILVHDGCIKACLPQIYGDRFNDNIQRIMEEMKINEIKSQLMVTMPRRMGKTVSIAQYAAAYMYSQPGANVIVYSPSRRASKMFLGVLFRMLIIIRGGDTSTGIYNQEQLSVLSHDGKTMSVCFSYPSKVETLRGTGGIVRECLTICEEIAAMNPEVLTKVVIPTLVMAGSVWIGISTIAGNGNFWSPLLNKRLPNGKLIFNCIRIYGSCTACRRNGTEKSCTHVSRPRWHSADRVEMIKSVMQDHLDTYYQETLGIEADSSGKQHVFTPESLEYLKSKLGRYSGSLGSVEGKSLYCVVDPAGGGNSSYTVSTFARIAINDPDSPGESILVLLAADKMRTTNIPACRKMVYHHIQKMKEIYNPRSIIFCPESNMWPETITMVNDICKKRLDYVTIYEEKKDGVGVLTTNDTKKMMAESMVNLLSKKTFLIHDDFISCEGDDPDNMLGEILSQLRGYTKELKISQSTGKITEKFSGKAGSNSDDLAVVMQLGAYISPIAENYQGRFVNALLKLRLLGHK